MDELLEQYTGEKKFLILNPPSSLKDLWCNYDVFIKEKI
jgi:hypothetical protein